MKKFSKYDQGRIDTALVAIEAHITSICRYAFRHQNYKMLDDMEKALDIVKPYTERIWASELEDEA